MATQPPLIQRCLDEAAEQMRAALLQAAGEAIECLQAEESATRNIAERDRLYAAWRGLQQAQRALGEAYRDAIGSALELAPDVEDARLAPFTPSVLGALEASPSGLGGLSLVDDEQMAQNLAFAHLVQQWRLQVDPVMTDFDAWVSAALGLAEVAPERNPLRPEIFARALLIVVNGAAPDAAMRARWLRLMAVPMGRALRAVYERVLQHLRSDAQAPSGPARYRLQPSRAAGGTAAAAGPRADDGAGGVAGVGGIDVSAGAAIPSNGDAGSPGAGGAGATPPLASEQIDEALAGFLRGEALPLDAPVHDGHRAALWGGDEVADGAGRVGDAQSAGRDAAAQRTLDARWGELAEPARRLDLRRDVQRRARRVDQALGVEVVRRVVAQVADDPRLLDPVREAIIAIEPVLLRLALVDPRFVVDQTHPGRRLISGVAQRSFKFHDADSPGFDRFYTHVLSTFQGLHRLDAIDGAGPFRDALGRLEAQWLREDAEEQAERARSLQQLQFAERRQELANEIAYELSQRPDLNGVPAPVLDFLFGPWALVMAHARLLDTTQQLDPSGFGLVVPDLVWSVKPALTLRQPSKLLDLVPPMLRRIQAGLDLIGMPEPERQGFFDVLLQLHEPVLRLRRERAALQSLAPESPLPASWQAGAPAERLPPAPQTPWLAPHERADLGLGEAAQVRGADAGPTGVADQADSAAMTLDSAAMALHGPESPTPMPDADDEQLVAAVLGRLQSSRWADLQVRQRWRRVQLSWVSANQALFLFHGARGRAYTMTRRVLVRLLKQDQLRPVDASDVVARALERLQQQAAPAKPPRA